VSHRLKRFLGIDSNLLYPPVPRAGLHPERFDPFILSVARLDVSKRVREAIDAIGVRDAGLRLEIVGDGPERAALERLVSRRGLGNRVVFHGRADDDALRRLYNTCRAVYYAPIDEDYGYSTVEALAAGKPVITAPDSGGVREFVVDGVTGIVTSIEPQPLAEAFARFSDEEFARELGARGPELTARLTWDDVVDTLLGD
jgi:glycosyltransferase involved in cell wall biosynthesis